jgi:valyl-tRNA synthetase
VKSRAYGQAEGGVTAATAATASARAALALALSVQLRLLAPFLPFVTEEVWSWWREGSIHRAAWPDPSELPSDAATDPSLLDAVAEALAAVRRFKTNEKRSLRARVSRLQIVDTPDRLAAMATGGGDLCEAGNVEELVLIEGAETSFVVELAPEDA